MPITQDRFSTIILAARTFYDSLEHLRATTERQIELAIAGQKTYQEAFEFVYSRAKISEPPSRLTLELGKEEQHFKLTRAKNERTAERMRRHRRGEGIQPRESKAARKRRELRERVEFEYEDGTTRVEGASTPGQTISASAGTDTGSLEVTTVPTAPPSPDDVEFVDFGPEPSPLELAEQILRDNEEIARMQAQGISGDSHIIQGDAPGDRTKG